MSGATKTFLLMLFNLGVGFYFGYTTDRPIEVESTKPIVFTFEVTPEAARAMTLKGVEGFPTMAEGAGDEEAN